MDVQLFGEAGALARPQVLREDRPEGGFVLRSAQALQPYSRAVGDWLEHWARTTPTAPFLAERSGPAAWRRLSYAEVRSQVGRIAQSLLDLRLAEGAPVVVLSDNAIDHALLALACMHIGRPVCTVSSAYSRLTKDYGKLAAIVAALEPALLYASDAAVYGAALAAVAGGRPVVASANAAAHPGARTFAELLGTAETPQVAAAFERIRPDDTAKYLLTSGSTGMPKVVVNTHRMLCANQQMMTQAWPFLVCHRLVLLDWLPWSHTFGGNHNFNLVLAHGGTLHIDEGRPAPGLIERTLANLREVQPNFWFNVPRGYDLLLPYLESDESIARDVFANLEGLFYAGAALPQSVWQRLAGVAQRVRERPLWFTSSWGSTETAPAVTSVHWGIDRAGCIGAPLPGIELKFVPNAGKLEMRVRAPSVFPGYRNAPELSAQAFDEEGYYRIGDAGRLVDAADPSQGVAFDGRVAEDFKLMSGTWVSVGTLRLKVISAFAPHVADAVITGHDREEVGLLLFPTPRASALPPGELAAHVRSGLQALRDEGGGSSHTPTRAMVMDEPPSADAGEITDKGYLNQRAVLERRAHAVLALYMPVTDPRVIRA